MSWCSISVVVAVYDGESFVGDALRSILAQTLPPFEVCVVDDGSRDGTRRVVQSYPTVRYVYQDNAGQAAALNRGVAVTLGNYLAFLDADDVWMHDKLERQRRAFDADPALDVVYGLMRERVLSGAASLAAREGRVHPAQLPSAMLIKRAAFERVGGFDPRFTLGSVVDFYARAREAGLREQIVPFVVYERRIHGKNLGIQRADRRSDYLTVVKAAIDRRRQLEAPEAGRPPGERAEPEEDR